MDNLPYVINKEDIIVSFNKNKINSVKNRGSIKEFLLIAYFRKNITPLGYVNTTLNVISEECGYSTKSNSKPVNKEFKSIILDLISNGYISCNVEIDKLKNNDFFRIKFCPDKNIFYCDDKFVQLNMCEFDQIIKNETKSRKDILLLTYLLIKQYLYYDGCSPILAYPQKSKLLNGLNVTSYTTVNTAIQDLVDIRILYISDEYFYEDENHNIIPCRKVYTTEKNQLKQAKTALKELYNGKEILEKSEVKLDNIKYRR